MSDSICNLMPGARTKSADCSASTASAIAIVLKGYPRLSETFIAQEIHALEVCGLRLRLVSLRHPTDAQNHPVHRQIQAPVRYLPEYAFREPLRVARAWWRVRKLPGYAAAWQVFVRDLRRDRTSNRVRRFAQAVVLADELEADVSWLHAHFLHTPASVARYAALIRCLPWSASAHARDIWTSPDWEKREKLDESQFTVTCTQHNVEHLRALTARADAISLVYHGLDLRRFAPPANGFDMRDGSNAKHPVRLLSVGRAVQKKGYSTLLEALALLPQGCAWTLDHVGGGPLLGELRKQAVALGLDERIHWHGAQAQEQVLVRYQQADVFVLASVVAADGDRDGLPNVLMEAQSQRLACVATDVSAVPELIEHERTGLLAAPGDATQLARTLERVITAPALRNTLALAGEARVREHFNMQDGVNVLLRRFESALKSRAAAR